MTTRALVALFALSSSCSSPHDASSCGLRKVAVAITQGSLESRYVGLEESQQRAIVALDIRLDQTTEFCSGVVIAADWVLTAAHCVHLTQPRNVVVSFGAETETASQHVLGENFVVHEGRDLMLVGLPAGSTVGAGITPIPAPDLEFAEFGPGSLVELAGFGLTEDSQLGERRHAVEMVVGLDQNVIRVSGGPLGGACVGDSGGPLLTRDRRGRAVAMGILSHGEGGCVGEDSYERLDSAAEWLHDHISSEIVSAAACPLALGEQGRCFDGTAVWCQEGRLNATSCAESCGWSHAAHGYRCVTTDPCAGISEFGECSGTRALRCIDGSIVEATCDECAGSCERSPRDGKVGCLIP